MRSHEKGRKCVHVEDGILVRGLYGADDGMEKRQWGGQDRKGLFAYIKVHLSRLD